MEHRIVERLIKGNWEECKMYQLKIGQIFRMFEPTGEPVVGKFEDTQWIVTSEPFKLDGVWAVDIEHYDIAL